MQNIKLSNFSSLLMQSIMGLFLLFVIFIFDFKLEQNRNQNNENRITSLLLMHELRQSSDDLTRMVRTYIVTKNSIYKEHYLEILDIRNGTRNRPVNYNNIYWDLVQTNNFRPKPFSNQNVSLIELMRNAKFTQKEFSKLSEAKKESDDLTKIEFRAMKILESKDGDIHLNQQKALELLHNDLYHQKKASIMKPLDECYSLINARTAKAVEHTNNLALIMKILLNGVGLFVLFTFYRLYKELKAILGGSLDDVHEHIIKIGRGESAPIYVEPKFKNSILGWLSETQERLQSLLRTNERLKQLYSARSECNLAIVQSKNEIELFSRICHHIVDFGGLKMAWIGIVDPSSNRLDIAASFGEGLEYLDNLHISIDPEDPSSLGPTGRTFRENKPYWCQDFQHDPMTEKWHDMGKKFGWGASAALPIQCCDTTIGVLTIYAYEVNIFDLQIKKLLQAIAQDISHALDSFHNEKIRKEIENELIATTQTAQNYLDIVDVIILVLDTHQKIKLLNRKGCEILGYSSEDVLEKDWVSMFIPQHDQAKIKELINDLVNSQTPPPPYYENDIVTKNGNVRTIAWRNQALYDELGNIIGFLCSGDDITEIRSTQNKLIESEDFYRTIVTSIDKAIIILENGYVVDCNEVALSLFEISKQEFLQSNITTFTWNFESSNRTFRDYLQDAYHGQIARAECTFTTIHNTIKILDLTLAKYGENINKIIILARDITDKIAKDKLLTMHSRQAQMGEMISMIAHQWRQPLAVINAITTQHLMKECMKDEPDTFLLSNLDKIEKQSVYLSQTINDYRDFFRNDKPKEVIDLLFLIEQALTLVDHTIKTNNINIDTRVNAPTKVYAYRNEVLQVIVTLLKNSIDAFLHHAIEKPKIIITINHDDIYGLIKVYDNAGGIKKENIKKIFDPYFTTKDHSLGTGLGLYMSKMVIEDHCKGILEVESKHNETTFTIKLPWENHEVI